MGVKAFDVMDLGKIGMFNPEQVSYEDSIGIIKDELQKTRKSFIKIGWYLKHIQEWKMYQEEGYSSIYEFAFDKFNLTQPTATRFIQICEEFSVNHNSPELDTKYESFSVSQLFEMLPMSQEQKEIITPEMTVREIREIKKSKQPSDKDILSFYEKRLKKYDNGDLLCYLTEYYGKTHAGGNSPVDYASSLRGIRLNNSEEITWKAFVKRIRELVPREKMKTTEEDETIPGQTSIEKDFLEYLPTQNVEPETQEDESENFYATSHIENSATIIEGQYRELEAEECATVVLKLTKDDLTKGNLNKKHTENLLMSKAQIVLKLLEQGYIIQLLAEKS